MAGFPNIPNVPGVPSLPRDPNELIEDLVLIAADVLGLFPNQGVGEEWGLFLDGQPMVIAESVNSFAYKKGYEILKNPTEPNTNAGASAAIGFESYNKVERPGEIRIRFMTGGSLSDRQALEASVKAACASRYLMDAVTPEVTYTNINPTHFDYERRSNNGLGLYIFDVHCEEVRVDATSTFSTTSGSTAAAGAQTFKSSEINITIKKPQSASAAPLINDGTVQPVQASSGQFDLSQALP